MIRHIQWHSDTDWGIPGDNELTVICRAKCYTLSFPYITSDLDKWFLHGQCLYRRCAQWTIAGCIIQRRLHNHISDEILVYLSSTFTTLYTNLADDTSVTVVIFFPENNRIWHFMLIFFTEDMWFAWNVKFCFQEKERKKFQNVLCWKVYPIMLSIFFFNGVYFFIFFFLCTP